MNKKYYNTLFIFIFFTIVFFVILYIFPFGKLLISSFFIDDDLLFSNYSEISKKEISQKNFVCIDMSYILLKNNIFESAKNYLNSIDLFELKNSDKAMILNYKAYLYFKNGDLINAKNYLIEGCKLSPNNKILIHNLNYILNLLNNQISSNNEDKNESSITNIIEYQSQNNLQNAENQILKSRLEKIKDTKNERYW